MTKKQFISNNRGINKGKDLPPQFLENIYDNIVKEEIELDSVKFISAFASPEKSGWLIKESRADRLIKKNNKRWFLLSENVLYYFQDHGKLKEGKPRGLIPLEDIVIEELEGRTGFEIKHKLGEKIKSCKFGTNGRPYEGRHDRFIFVCDNINDAREWIERIKERVVSDPLLAMMEKRKELIKKQFTQNHHDEI